MRQEQGHSGAGMTEDTISIAKAMTESQSVPTRSASAAHQSQLRGGPAKK
jgi:hypothetical protein